VLLNNIKHWQQQREDDCLIACCKMVLDYLGIDKETGWLWQQLAVDQVTPFPRIITLAAALGIVVDVSTGGALAQFAPILEAGLPIIVAVDADGPSYWPYVRHHAAVVVGFDEEYVFINDPAQTETPLAIDRGTFLLAWSRRDNQYAVIRLTEDA